jgi:hypothetical protein
MEVASSVGKSEPTSLVEASTDKVRELELLGFCKGEGLASILGPTTPAAFNLWRDLRVVFSTS